MKTTYRTILTTMIFPVVILTGGCDDPQSGSAIGGLLGTIAGAYVGNANGNMLGGAALGQQLGSQVGGAIGLLNQEQIVYLQQNAPQTLATIQNNDQVVQQQASGSSSGTLTPVSEDNIEKLTAAGVKSDAIIKFIQTSQATYSQADISAAQQASPAIDPDVITYMQNHLS
jgi:outer membrane lipoprotein SlyB